MKQYLNWTVDTNKHFHRFLKIYVTGMFYLNIMLYINKKIKNMDIFTLNVFS